MAAGVSINDTMLLPLLLMILSVTLTLPAGQSMAFSYSSEPAPRSSTDDPFLNYTCPNTCMCYKMNETSRNPMVWISCTIPFFSPSLKDTLDMVSNPLTGYAFFTCSYGSIDYQDFTPESSLWDGAFDRLISLKALVFSECKFTSLSKGAFRGLNSLVRLIIRDASINYLDPDLLLYLPKLDELEISYSSLTHLFPMCSANSVRVLNISGNHLVSLEDSGLHCSSGPLRSLETLDVNRNFLTEIPQWLGQSLPNLHHLGLADNYVTESRGSPFRDFSKLAFLDISNNSFSELGYHFLKGCGNLHTLGLQMNNVSKIPSGLFSELLFLQFLDLSEMNLDDRVWMEMIQLRSLLYLNMSHNQLTSINAGVMSQFLRLKMVYLSHNKISSFPRTGLEYQRSLTSLDLSNNQIPDIPAGAFSNQVELQELFLSHNNITTVGQDAFLKLGKLLTFDISHNSINSLPAKAFDDLEKVQVIDLSSNRLLSLENDLFSNANEIKQLNMSHNQLKNIPKVAHLTNLEIIDISHNNISVLQPSTFIELGMLKVVILHHNNMQFLPIKLFKGCDSVQSIDMSHNALQILDEASFSHAGHVKTINLSHNAISDLGTVFSGLKNIEVLDLSYNKLSKVLRGQFPRSIKHINLQNNNIEFISAHTFKTLTSIEIVILSANKLTSLSRMDVEIAFNLGYSPTFKIQFNPFVCDCHLGWLKDWSQGKLKDMLTLPTFDISTGLRCTSPFHPFTKNLLSLSRSEFLCNYTNHCEESCMCCDYDACYCKYRCPSACQCYIGDDYLHVHHVQCSSASLTAVPAGLPEGATDLHLDDNNIQTLYRHTFLALKHVEVMYLNHSQIHSIQNSTFKGLKSIKSLYLNDNFLTAIYSVTFKGMDNLEELYLQNNDIYSIDNQALLTPPFLNLVNLQGNALTTFIIDELWRFTNRTVSSPVKSRLYLSGNPWSCETDFACKFLQFLEANSDSIEDISYIECLSPGTTEKPVQVHPHGSAILDLQTSLCADNSTLQTNMTSQSVQASNSDAETYALIAACIVVAFALALLIVAYVNRHLLQVLCFTRFGCRVFKMAKASDDGERPYDAFISYSNKDEEFVIRQLAPRLEDGDKKFRLCVHYRDFPVGACIAETIVRSVEASKRTILVVSDNFLDSEWCRFEFQTAHQQVLSERRNRVILILMHDLDSEKLDSTLKVYMRTRTYLKFDDPWFWEKLMFAMPDIRHRKQDPPSRLPSCRDLEYMARDRRLSEQNQGQGQPQQQVCQNPHRNGTRCGTIHNDMYEIPVLDTASIHYQLANGVCCSTHTNSAYHNSDGSDSTSGYHNGSVCGSCGHYEEVGPGSSSMQSTPQKQIGTPPPVPSIPKEGFVPKERLQSIKT